MTKDKVHICNCPSLEIILERYATELPVGDITYYELPFWFTREDSGVVMYFKPPAEVKDFLLRAGLGNPNPQKVKKVQ